MTSAACPKCNTPGEAVFCPRCDTLLPPRELDHFTLLGAPRRPWLEEGPLKEAYHRLSMRLHPDHARERREDAVVWSSHLNKAYATLRDPRDRLQYLVSLETGSNPLGPGTAPVTPDMMKLSLEVQKFCQAFDPWSSRPPRASPMLAAGRALEKAEHEKRLATLQAAVAERRRRVMEEIRALDARWTTGERAPLGKKLAEQASWLSYLNKFDSLLAERLLALRSGTPIAPEPFH
ncbi:MAG: DnaJ domain-containing protein [Euryarchaeota archaeon]|nr:DnaJ domain-containing protein [Euryarchaeota archaeon]